MTSQYLFHHNIKSEQKFRVHYMYHLSGIVRQLKDNDS